MKKAKQSKTSSVRKRIPKGRKVIDGEIIPPQPKANQFQPGNQMAVGHGSPAKRRPVTQQLISALYEAADKKSGITKIRKLVDKLIELACDGDLDAIKEIIDRIEGKPIPVTSMPGEDDENGDTSVTMVISRRMNQVEASRAYAELVKR